MLASLRVSSCSSPLNFNAAALYQDPAATLNDMRESVTMLEETGRTAQRVLGGTQPVTTGIEDNLRRARAALAAREGDDVNSA